MNPQNNMPQNNGMNFGAPANAGDGMGAAPAPAPAPAASAPVKVKRELDAESWRKIGITSAIIAVGCLIGVIIAFVIQSGLTGRVAELEAQNRELDLTLNNFYKEVGASEFDTAVGIIRRDSILSGADVVAINKLLGEAYGEDYRLDAEDATINFVKKDAKFTVVSLGIERTEGTARAILYAMHSTGEWVYVRYEKTANRPCAFATQDDLEILKSISLCLDESSDEELRDTARSGGDEDSSDPDSDSAETDASGGNASGSGETSTETQ